MWTFSARVNTCKGWYGKDWDNQDCVETRDNKTSNGKENKRLKYVFGYFFSDVSEFTDFYDSS